MLKQNAPSNTNGIIALITYAHHRVNAKIDVPSLHYYHDVIGNYWPAERKWVENGYRDLPFPFTEIPAPEFKLEAHWSLPHFVGYQATWVCLKYLPHQTIGSNSTKPKPADKPNCPV